MKPSILSIEAVRHALNLRDLTNPKDGPHGVQIIIDDILQQLRSTWACEVKLHRESPIVTIEDNYDRLHYPRDGAARDACYTRYVCGSALLRTMTSAMIPRAMRLAAKDMPTDIVLACPGIVYRRDVIDRLHTGKPHQIDLWRICRKTVATTDLEEMVRIVVQSVVPGRKWRTEPRVHPYTLEGLQIDVLDGEEWIEIGECGLVRPEILAENIPHVKEVTGLAMGLGLDRILMVRKGIPDIRYLRSNDPRIASQMLDLTPYRAVSSMPAVIRDISLVLDEDLSSEELGDRVRELLGCEANAVEAVEILSQTSYHALPPAAIKRLGIRKGQTNILVRIVLRALDRTLTNDECNTYRDTIYECLHRGSSWQWASKSQK